MAGKWNLFIMLKSGKSYNIHPFLNEGETSQEAACRMLTSINNAMEEGKTFHTLVTGGTNNLSTIIRLDSIEIAYTSELKDTTQEDKEAAEKKLAEEKRRAVSDRLNELYVAYYEDLEKRLAERRPVDDKLTQLQIEHYEIINQGEDWKKGERGF